LHSELATLKNELAALQGDLATARVELAAEIAALPLAPDEQAVAEEIKRQLDVARPLALEPSIEEVSNGLHSELATLQGEQTASAATLGALKSALTALGSEVGYGARRTGR